MAGVIAVSKLIAEVFFRHANPLRQQCQAVAPARQLHAQAGAILVEEGHTDEGRNVQCHPQGDAWITLLDF